MFMLNVKLLSLLALAFGILFQVRAASRLPPAGIGPFKAQLQSQKACPSSEKCNPKLAVYNMKVARDPNELFKYTYNGNVNLSVPIGDSHRVELRVSKWANSLGGSGGWTNNVFRLNVDNPCTAFKNRVPEIFKAIMDTLYAGKNTECPFIPVATEIKDLTLTTNPPKNFKQAPYGRYRTRQKIFEPSNECIFCYDVVVDIVPKNY